MTHTSARTWQYLGLIVIALAMGGGYWYFSARAGVKQGAPLGGPAASNLVGYWSFDGDDISGTTAYDRSGSGNNGTTSGSPVKTDGKLGQALLFDGVNDSVLINTGLATGNQPNTVAAWIRVDNLPATGRSWPLLLGQSSGGSLHWLIGTTGVTQIGIWGGPYVAPTFSTGRWFHFVTTYDGTTLRAYIDGVLNSSVVAGAGFSVTSMTLGLPQLSEKYFNGAMDELRVYNTALTAAQVYDLYKLGGETVGASTPTRDSLNEGLAGYWKLDDASGVTATDSSGNGNSGTLTNGPTWGTGQIGGATTFDGTDDYITLGSPTALDNITQKTVTAWVKLTTFGEGSVGSILNKYHTTSAGWNLWVDDNGGGLQRLRFDQHFSGLSGQWNTPTNVLTTGQWMFVTVSYDRSSTANDPVFYVNGIRRTTGEGQGPLGSASDDSANDLYIGNRSGLDRTFNGSIDEVRVYNRILSAEEVTRLYKTTTPSNPDTRLKGYWSFDGDAISGTTALDLSGAGNNGTLTNNPIITEGIRGQAMSFAGSGSNNYVNVPQSTSIDFGAAQDFTVATWVKTTQSPALNVWTQIINKEDATATRQGYGIYLHDSTINARWAFYIYSAGTPYVAYGASDVADGQWHYLVGVRNGSTIYSYQDGVLASTTSATNGSLTKAVPLNFARNTSLGVQYYDGSLDEVRIYNAALTASEIYNLYQEGGVKLNKSQSNNGDSLNDGLAGYWKLDDGSGTTAVDSSGNSNNGTLTNGPTWGTGQIGGAVTFDGTNDYIAVPNSTSLQEVNRFTASVWVKPNLTSGTIVGKHTLSGFLGWTFGFGNTSGSGCSGGKIAFSFNSGWTCTSAAVVTTGSWQHLVLVYDGSNVTLYRDGTVVQTIAKSAPTTSSAVLFIGNSFDSTGTPNGSYFDGQLDEVRVYNRALSAEEVAKLYKTTSPINPETGLVGYWSFNGKDMAGTTAYDRSGKGNNGTLTLGPTITEGRIGQAINFDGSDDYVAMPSLDFGSTFSISLWMKPYADGNSSARGIINRAQVTCQTNGFSVLTRVAGGSAGQIVVQTGDGSNCDTAPTNTGVLHYGQWDHLVVTVDKTGGTARIYLNGTDITIDTTILTTFSTSGVWNIGKISTAFPGALDEVRIYNRVLTPTEITSLYNFGR